MRQYLAPFLLVAALSTSSLATAQSDADVAAAVMRRAQEAYDEGDFERAAVLLEESAELYEAPAIHYNLARTYSELSRWEDARDQFERFLELSPQSERRDAVEARLAELERRIAREESLRTPDPVEASPDGAPGPDATNLDVPEQSAPLNSAPLLLLGGGAVVGLAAIPFGLASRNATDRAAEAPTHRAGSQELDTARRHARVTNALWITGGVVALAGLIWVLVKPRRSESQASFDGTLHLRF
ncbi:MAG: tetratricopeptide repeat protein [Polyangiales bacterium]